jgi:nucleoside 2-deoxyribosyltransferase
MKIYLSGNMSPNPDYYDYWTKDLKHLLKDSKFTCSESRLKDPMDSKFIVQHDFARLKRCDMVIANLSVQDTSHHMTGAVVEIYEAYKQNKPVYTFFDSSRFKSEQSSSPWIHEFVTKHFNTLEELLDFIIFEDNL